MYQTLFAARQQGMSDGKSAGELAATRLALPPTPALAWAKAQLAQRGQGDLYDLTWRIVYAVTWLQAAQQTRYPGWARRLNHLEQLERAYSEAAAWLAEEASPEVNYPATLHAALRCYHVAGAQVQRARARLLLAWKKLAQEQLQPTRKAS